jgi:hypothetical protein
MSRTVTVNIYEVVEERKSTWRADVTVNGDIKLQPVKRDLFVKVMPSVVTRLRSFANENPSKNVPFRIDKVTFKGEDDSTSKVAHNFKEALKRGVKTMPTEEVEFDD